MGRAEGETKYELRQAEQSFEVRENTLYRKQFHILVLCNPVIHHMGMNRFHFHFAREFSSGKSLCQSGKATNCLKPLLNILFCPIKMSTAPLRLKCGNWERLRPRSDYFRYFWDYLDCEKIKLYIVCLLLE